MHDLKFEIVVFNSNVEDSDYGLSEAREQSFNKDLVLTEIVLAESMFLDPQFIKIIAIINELNNSMIGIHEDDIIYDQHTIEQCLEVFRNEFQMLTQDKIVSDIIGLFEKALSAEKNIYFLF